MKLAVKNQQVEKEVLDYLLKNLDEEQAHYRLNEAVKRVYALREKKVDLRLVK